MDIDRISVLSIFMHFHNQFFQGVDFVFDPQNHSKIYAIMAKEKGSQGDSDAEGTHWRTAHVKILLTERELIVSHLNF
ncbi:hypothetical protein KJ966_17695 [bacterium]|nr:hypothetical protein [bacterium]